MNSCQPPPVLSVEKISPSTSSAAEADNLQVDLDVDGQVVVDMIEAIEMGEATIEVIEEEDKDENLMRIKLAPTSGSQSGRLDESEDDVSVSKFQIGAKEDWSEDPLLMPISSNPNPGGQINGMEMGEPLDFQAFKYGQKNLLPISFTSVSESQVVNYAKVYNEDHLPTSSTPGSPRGHGHEVEMASGESSLIKPRLRDRLVTAQLNTSKE